jgi:hypothetical protein
MLDVRGGRVVGMQVLSEPRPTMLYPGQRWVPVTYATSTWSFEDARNKVLAMWADLDPYTKQQLIGDALTGIAA